MAPNKTFMRAKLNPWFTPKMVLTLLLRVKKKPRTLMLMPLLRTYCMTWFTPNKVLKMISFVVVWMISPDVEAQ